MESAFSGTGGLILGFEIGGEPLLVCLADRGAGQGTDDQDKLSLEKRIKIPFQGIVHPHTTASIMQPPVFFQIGQVTGDRRLRHVEGVHKITDAEFNPSLQEQDQAKPGFVSQGFEGIDSCIHSLFLLHQRTKVNSNKMVTT
jgi:hypothetical protein